MAKTTHDFVKTLYVGKEGKKIYADFLSRVNRVENNRATNLQTLITKTEKVIKPLGFKKEEVEIVNGYYHSNSSGGPKKCDRLSETELEKLCKNLGLKNPEKKSDPEKEEKLELV